MARMPLARRCRPPVAWLAMIAREPRLMMADYEPELIDLTPEKLKQLSYVQNAVNASARYQREARDTWGRWHWRRVLGLTGRWRRIRVGDCDDFAVEKLRRLLDIGFGGSLRLVACRVRVGHLVLAVDTTETTMILDNRHSGIWAWDDPRFDRYSWLASSVPGRKMWSRIAAAPTLEDLAKRAGA